MITGVVRNNEPVILLTIYTSRGTPTTIEAVIDTGFTESLTLSPELIDQCRVGPVDFTELQFADGRIELHEIATVQVEWGDEVKSVEAASLDGTSLIGMTFLRNHRLLIEVADGGRVLLEPLPPANQT